MLEEIVSHARAGAADHPPGRRLHGHDPRPLGRGRGRPDLLPGALRERGVPADGDPARVDRAARPPDRLPAPPRSRGARVARVHGRRRQELPRRPRPPRAERPRPGRAAADLRGARDRHRRLAAQPPSRHARPVRRQPARGRARPRRSSRPARQGSRRRADWRAATASPSTRPAPPGSVEVFTLDDVRIEEDRVELVVARAGARLVERGEPDREGRPHLPVVRAHRRFELDDPVQPERPRRDPLDADHDRVRARRRPDDPARVARREPRGGREAARRRRGRLDHAGHRHGGGDRRRRASAR